MAAAARHAIATPIGPNPPVTPDPAQTQRRQAITGDSTTAATQHSAPAPPSPPGKRRRGVLIGALVGVAVLIAGAVFGGVWLLRDHEPAATPTTTASAPPGTAPFTGIYRADFSATTLVDGQTVEGATLMTARWGVRSACRPGGCVATAMRLSGEGPAVSSLVFDEIDGRWMAVGLGSDQCHNAPAEVWDVFTLEPRPDGTLSGEFRGTTSDGCSGRGTVTFARTGSLDENTLPDPATLPPRNHAGDRCMSYFHAPSDFRPLIFSDGKWTSELQFDGKCPPPGGPTHLKYTAQFPLPEPPQDPITLLIGNGRQEQTGNCAASTAVTETFTRTGD
jgi:serine/threonine-protein kinase